MAVETEELTASQVSSDGDSKPVMVENHDKNKKNDEKASYVLVPRGWNRIIEKGCITYISPNKSRLGSMEDLKDYLLLDGTCKCGLICPLVLSESFNFEASMPSRFNGSGMRNDTLPQKQSCCVAGVFDKAFPPVHHTDAQLAPKAKPRKRPQKDASQVKRKRPPTPPNIPAMASSKTNPKGTLQDGATTSLLQSHRRNGPAVKPGGFQPINAPKSMSIADLTSQLVANQQAQRTGMQRVSNQSQSSATSNVPLTALSDSARIAAIEKQPHSKLTIIPSNRLASGVPLGDKTLSCATVTASPAKFTACRPGDQGNSGHLFNEKPPPNVTMEPSMCHNLQEALQAERKRKLLDTNQEGAKKTIIVQHQRPAGGGLGKFSSSTELTYSAEASRVSISSISSTVHSPPSRNASELANSKSNPVHGKMNATSPVSSSSESQVRMPTPATKPIPQKPVASSNGGISTVGAGTLRPPLTIQPRQRPEGYAAQFALAGKNAFYTAPVSNSVTQYLIFGASGASQALQNLALQSTTQVNAVAHNNAAITTNRFIHPFTTQVNYVATSALGLHPSSVVSPAFHVPAAPAIMHYLPRVHTVESPSSVQAVPPSIQSSCISASASNNAANKNYVRIAPAAQEEKALYSVGQYSIGPVLQQDIVKINNRTFSTIPRGVTMTVGASSKQRKTTTDVRPATSPKSKPNNPNSVVTSTTGNCPVPSPSDDCIPQCSSDRPDETITAEGTSTAVGKPSFSDDQWVCGPHRGIQHWPGRIVSRSESLNLSDLAFVVSWLGTKETSTVAVSQLVEMEDKRSTLESARDCSDSAYAAACREGLHQIASKEVPAESTPQADSGQCVSVEPATTSS